jgi:hypothetical protein
LTGPERLKKSFERAKALAIGAVEALLPVVSDGHESGFT